LDQRCRHCATGKRISFSCAAEPTCTGCPRCLHGWASCSSVFVLLKLAARLCQLLGKPVDGAIALGQIDPEKLFLPVENPSPVKVSRKYHHEYDRYSLPSHRFPLLAPLTPSSNSPAKPKLAKRRIARAGRPIGRTAAPPTLSITAMNSGCHCQLYQIRIQRVVGRLRGRSSIQAPYRRRTR
jgi:hypothetical protein